MSLFSVSFNETNYWCTVPGVSEFAAARSVSIKTYQIQSYLQVTCFFIFFYTHTYIYIYITIHNFKATSTDDDQGLHPRKRAVQEQERKTWRVCCFGEGLKMEMVVSSNSTDK